MNRQNCPNSEILRAYLIGKVNDTTFAEVSDHLDTCAACQARLTALDTASDQLIASLRQSTLKDPSDDLPLDLVMQTIVRTPYPRDEMSQSMHLPRVRERTAIDTTPVTTRRRRRTRWTATTLVAAYRNVRQAQRSVPAWITSYFASAMLHLLIVITLACWLLPVLPRPRDFVIGSVAEDPDVSVLTVDDLDNPPDPDAAAFDLGSALQMLREQSLPRSWVNHLSLSEFLEFSDPSPQSKPFGRVEDLDDFMRSVPTGTFGSGGTVAQDYRDALHRLTQELVGLAATQNLLVIWCIDESESMKDDQQEIAEICGTVYAELEEEYHILSEQRMLTAVMSFGSSLHQHTNSPTNSWQEIQASIEAIPTDGTGKELICSSVARVIDQYRRFANVTNRRMILIVATDESGEPMDNRTHLESAITQAKQARTIIYVLGREAVFGYAKAHVSWRHPETNTVHSLPIDRGPETAFPELLQTDGLGPRGDGYPSGAGPYDLCRMASETDGTYFLLPDEEINLIKAEDGRRYRMSAMRDYLPDLRSRAEYRLAVRQSRFRSTIMRLVHALDPSTEANREIMNLRRSFSIDPGQFSAEATEELMRARRFRQALEAAEAELSLIQADRETEPSRRWKANYDLLLAQVVAYQIRLQQYAARLQQSLIDPPQVPIKANLTDVLQHWYVHSHRKLPADIQPQMARASKLYQVVIDEHPQTPWSSRAMWDLGNGFAIELRPFYQRPSPNQVERPIPKL